MPKTIYGITIEEVFRLICAYMAIRGPQQRRQFLKCIESWASEQWRVTDSEREKSRTESRTPGK